MSILNPQTAPETSSAVWQIGFRPFFLGATLFGLLAMVVWMASFGFGVGFGFAGLAPMRWHAHEMLYGYCFAVIAGFLLTAVRNWTGQMTIKGGRLAGLVGLWFGARVLLVLGPQALPFAAALDIAFGCGLFVAVLLPILKVKQWRQAGILAKVALLTIGNAAFYLGAFGALPDADRISLYAGLYVIIALILTMARRVMPFFIERGIEQSVTLRNNKAVDGAALAVFVVFFVAEVFVQSPDVAAWAAIVLAVLHTYRLIGWHAAGIWSRPLLWSLYLSYAALIVGFVLVPFTAWGGLAPLLALHAFAIGGVGTITVAMMARVSIGHTGRNVREPPASLRLPFAAVLLAVAVRVAMPLAMPTEYVLSVIIAQALWIVAFAALLAIIGPMLLQPRASP